MKTVFCKFSFIKSFNQIFFFLFKVQSLFGHDKKLLIPLIFDIANLVRTASKSSIQFPFKTSQHEQNLMIRRYFDLGITEPDYSFILQSASLV